MGNIFIIAVENRCWKFSGRMQPEGLLLAPAGMVDIGIYVGKEPVFMRLNLPAFNSNVWRSKDTLVSEENEGLE